MTDLAFYPEARIPETPMPANGEDPAAAKLDHLAEARGDGGSEI